MAPVPDPELPSGRVFDIQRWSLHDGPGIRTSVFLKGCPLRCNWCSNPESQDGHPELAYFVDNCIRCGRCVGLCPHGAITVQAGGMLTDRAICMAKCYRSNSFEPFACLARCYGGGRKQIGIMMSVQDVLREVTKDALIYEQSEGGVTFTGGEPMAQFDFLRALARASKEAWLHVAIETCGHAPWWKYEKVLPFVDFVFLDIKHLDSERHAELTGRPNTLILENASRIAEYMQSKRGAVVVRTPVIPGVTDADAIDAIADFICRRMPGVSTYELMPYHRLGRGKYRDIGRTYDMADVGPLKAAELGPLNDVVFSHGLSLKYQ
jgi:pyruvate formate lyase activating enzyme